MSIEVESIKRKLMQEAGEASARALWKQGVRSLTDIRVQMHNTDTPQFVDMALAFNKLRNQFLKSDSPSIR